MSILTSINEPLYTIEQVTDTLGHDLVLTDHDAFNIVDLDVNIIGRAYASMLQHLITSFLSSRWTLTRHTSVTLLNITWEHLNTGHWKDIDIQWRHAYYIVSYVKSVAEFAMACSSQPRDGFLADVKWREAIRFTEIMFITVQGCSCTFINIFPILKFVCMNNNNIYIPGIYFT